MRTVTTVAGKAPVDSECKTMLTKAHVYSEDSDTFDCMLNQVSTAFVAHRDPYARLQANVGNNNNKFYLIQLLEDNSSKNYFLWLRW